jgi:hypothetical protein
MVKRRKVYDGRCSFVKADGGRCKAVPRPGATWCTFHDPALAPERAEGRRRGGVARTRTAVTLPADTPDLPLRTVGDIVRALGLTFNHVRTGRLDARVGNCLGVLAGVLLRAIQGDELEQRLAALEARHGRGRR